MTDCRAACSIRGRAASLAYLFVELNGRDVRALQGLETPVQDGDTLSILIPVAGGRL